MLRASARERVRRDYRPEKPGPKRATSSAGSSQQRRLQQQEVHPVTVVETISRLANVVNTQFSGIDAAGIDAAGIACGMAPESETRRLWRRSASMWELIRTHQRSRRQRSPCVARRARRPGRARGRARRARRCGGAARRPARTASDGSDGEPPPRRPETLSRYSAAGVVPVSVGNSSADQVWALDSGGPGGRQTPGYCTQGSYPVPTSTTWGGR